MPLVKRYLPYVGCLLIGLLVGWSAAKWGPWASSGFQAVNTIGGPLLVDVGSGQTWGYSTKDKTWIVLKGGPAGPAAVPTTQRAPWTPPERTAAEITAAIEKMQARRAAGWPPGGRKRFKDFRAEEDEAKRAAERRQPTSSTQPS